MSALTVALALGLAAAAPPQASALPDPNAGAFTRPPPNRLSTAQAIAIAARTGAVRRAVQRYGELKGYVCAPETPNCVASDCFWPSCRDEWQLVYYQGTKSRAEVRIRDRTEAVTAAWEGVQLDWQIARGVPGFLGGHVNALWVWLPLCLLFVAPFVDFRRPLRLLHLDLLALLAFSVSQVFFNRGDIALSVPLVYPVLGYLLVRLLIAGVRPRRGSGALIPHARPLWLAIALVCLVCFRVGLNLADSTISDVGGKTAIAATRLAQGHSPYARGDAYGPVTYLAYASFAAVWPSSTQVTAGRGRFAGLSFSEPQAPAAHAAAIFFDLLTALGLLLLGRRMRGGREGRLLGLGLAYAWLSYPYALYALSSNTNDALISCLLLLSLLTFARPAFRLAGIVLATAAKLAPGALIPLFALADGKRQFKRLLPAAAALALMGALALLLAPHASLAKTLDGALFQVKRTSPFSVWGQFSWLTWPHAAWEAGVIALAVLVAFVPRKKSATQAAALAAAVLIAAEMALPYWSYFYIVWFAPYALVALFSDHARGESAPVVR
ncbi:MAG: glycosyltransferase 87 family protein [Solirubrobacteraceae bacterium]